MTKADLERIATEERKAYFRAWRAKPENKKRTAEHRRRYWQKKAMERLRNKESEVQGNDTDNK